MVKHTQTIHRLLPTNCLNVFGHFVGLVLNGLKRNWNFDFLGPRIWEIVSDYIKKSNNLEEFKLKIKLRNPEKWLHKRFLRQVCFL